MGIRLRKRRAGALRCVALAVAAISITVLFAAGGARTAVAEHGRTDRVDVMTWNIRRGLQGSGPFGVDVGIEVVERFKDRMLAFEIDVGAFQEITFPQASELARRLGWEPPHYAQTKDRCSPVIDKPLICEPFGNALLSRYPAQDRGVFPYPVVAGDQGEVRNVIRFGLTPPGGSFMYFYNTHLVAALEKPEPEGEVARADQANRLLAYVAEDKRVVSFARTMLLGDFNSDQADPASGILRTQFDDAGPANIPTTIGGRRFDYVYVAKGSGIVVKSSQVDVIAVGRSDHLPVVAELAVPTETCRPRASQSWVAPAAIGFAAPLPGQGDCGRNGATAPGT